MADKSGTETSNFDKVLAESLCNLETPQKIRFSPNGERVLYSTTLCGSQRKGKASISTLWLASTDTAGSSRQLTSGLYEDRDPEWHPNGKQISFLSDRAKPDESSALWLLSLEGGDPCPITPVENTQSIDEYAFSPDGKVIAFISADEKSEELKQKEEDDETDPMVWGEDWEYARLRLVDVASKKIRTLVSGERHITSVSWSPDGKNILFDSGENPDIEENMLTGTTISTVNVESGEVRDLCKLTNEPWDLTWAPDGKIYLITGTPIDKESGGSALYVIDPTAASPSPVKIAYGVEDDAERLVLVGDRLIVSRQKRFQTVFDEFGKDTLFTKDTNVDVWDIFFGENGDSPILAGRLSDVNTPNEVYVTKGDTVTRLSDHGRDFRDTKFGSFTVLTCKSSDGEVELDGVYLAPTSSIGPDGVPKVPLPTFVMIHGGPLDRTCNAFNACDFMWTPYVLSKGYGILLPQYRGGSGRGEKFAMYSIGGQGVYDYADVITITDNAISRGFADGSKLLVGGYSQGGFLSYLCSVRNGLHGHGWRFNAAIAGAGVCDNDSLPLTADLGSTFESEMNNGNVPWTMDPHDTSNRKASAIWEVAGAVREARRLGQFVIPPMLILHGENDKRCPFSQAEGFRRALRAYNLPCEFVRYPRQRHSVEEQKFYLDMMERIGRWCDTYIGPSPSTKGEITLTIN